MLLQLTLVPYNSIHKYVTRELRVTSADINKPRGLQWSRMKKLDTSNLECNNGWPTISIFKKAAQRLLLHKS